ncbi:MAG TPA: hypothetical protein VFV23_10610 [Verrucomicrobiae bacterium]|nr:hypothetical protein [Verrucomicrobiae bacterium]
MKRTIALLFVVCAAALSGCSGGSSDKTEIQSVFDQYAKIKNANPEFSSDRRIEGLMAIDVSRCPSDFRSAWFDYLSELENLHAKVKRTVVFAAEEKKPVTDLPSLVKFSVANPPIGQSLLNELNNVDAAWSKAQRVAMNYGVMPELPANEAPPITSEKR